MTTLVDARGCLTAAGLDVLAGSPPGGGPRELAAHVVACARCQGRLLARGLGPRSGRPVRPPSPWRTLAVAAALMALIVVAMVAVGYLRSR